MRIVVECTLTGNGLNCLIRCMFLYEPATGKGVSGPKAFYVLGLRSTGVRT